jgi:hypothetical protein
MARGGRVRSLAVVSVLVTVMVLLVGPGGSARAVFGALGVSRDRSVDVVGTVDSARS